LNILHHCDAATPEDLAHPAEVLFHPWITETVEFRHLKQEVLDITFAACTNRGPKNFRIIVRAALGFMGPYNVVMKKYSSGVMPCGFCHSSGSCPSSQSRVSLSTVSSELKWPAAVLSSASTARLNSARSGASMP
jgi:hypothetical protein